MTTQKQIEANQQNALLSTGAVTEAGKAIVAQNAVKHGVFTKDLIIGKGDGKENVEEYESLLNGLIASFSPNGQMEYLLVEKISVDFWRLKRVLRCETGFIRKHLDMAIDGYYHSSIEYNLTPVQTNEELKELIEDAKQGISWNEQYITALKNGEVSFDNPQWGNGKIKTKLIEDFYLILEKIKYRVLDASELKRYESGELDFDQIKTIFQKNQITNVDITKMLIQCLEEQIENDKKRINTFVKRQLKNELFEDIIVRSNSLPQSVEAEKIMRYERSLQKSIMQNILMLKQIQLSRPN